MPDDEWDALEASAKSRKGTISDVTVEGVEEITEIAEITGVGGDAICFDDGREPHTLSEVRNILRSAPDGCEVYTTAPPIKGLLDALCRAEDKMAAAKAEYDAIARDIGALAPVEIGEWKIVSPTSEVFITRPEKWSWDKDKLASKFSVDADAPPCVKYEVNVNKKKFLAMPVEEQAPIREALTIRPGPPKLTVARHNTGETDAGPDVDLDDAFESPF